MKKLLFFFFFQNIKKCDGQFVVKEMGKRRVKAMAVLSTKNIE